MSKKQNIHFIHANGFPPGAYKTLFNNLKDDTQITNFFLRPLVDSQKNTINEINNWIPFFNDFINSIKSEKNIIGMGHSIGGNIVLRAGLSHPNLFSKLVLLDPTLFIPRIIFLWSIVAKLNLQKRFHPWINATLNRKMIYDNFDEIFKSYRKKNVFKKISDNNLKIYINSITKIHNQKLHITYSKEWEHQIYKTGLIEDYYIWNNIKNIKVPTLIIKADDSNAFMDSAAKKIDKMNSEKIKIITIKDTTHLFPLEVPEKASKIISDFIKE